MYILQGDSKKPGSLPRSFGLFYLHARKVAMGMPSLLLLLLSLVLRCCLIVASGITTSNSSENSHDHEKLHIKLLYSKNVQGSWINQHEKIMLGTAVRLVSPWAQTANLFMELEHALSLVDLLGGDFFVDGDWRKFIDTYVDSTMLRVKYTSDFDNYATATVSKNNVYDLSGEIAYSMQHPKPRFYSRVLPAKHFRLEARAMRLAEPNPLITVHDRDLDGNCLTWIKNPWFCINREAQYKSEWDSLCGLHKVNNLYKYIMDELKPASPPGRILVSSDGHHPISAVIESDTTGTVRLLKQSEMSYLAMGWLCVLSDHHVGLPVSSFDNLISHWRLAYGQSPSHPKSCFEYTTLIGQK